MKTYGIKKTIVRATITFPDTYARVQRLYDYGSRYVLHEEIISGTEECANFILALTNQSAKLIDQNEYVDDDDFKTKQSFTYEMIT